MTVEIDPFRAISVSRLAHELKAQGRSIIHMEFGQPSTGAPKAAIGRAHHVLDTDGMGYWESPALRQRLSRHYAERYGVAVEDERFLDHPGIDLRGTMRAIVANIAWSFSICPLASACCKKSISSSGKSSVASTNIRR